MEADANSELKNTCRVVSSNVTFKISLKCYIDKSTVRRKQTTFTIIIDHCRFVRSSDSSWTNMLSV